MMPTIRVHAATAMAGRNVHAVGIGRKEVAGKQTKTVCVRLHVVQKVAPSLIAARDAIPATIDGIPTDIIESPPAFVLAGKAKSASRSKGKASARAASANCSANRKKRQRPIVAGISAAHYGVTAGTIAYFCRSTRDGDDPARIYVLSNNHVFADVNLANIGDDLYQQSPTDGGVAKDHFADLARYVHIIKGGTMANKVDAAIGVLRPNTRYRAEICRIGTLTGTETAAVGTKVRKHGRTTGYTEGEVSDIAYDALIGLDHSDNSVVGLFDDQIRIAVSSPYTAIGLGGDSGSMVVHRTRPRAVGLYFAGPPMGSYGIANHIDDVLNELEISLV